jgi:hypothetical protein
MASITDIPQQLRFSVAGILRTVGDWMIDVAEANSRRDQIEAFNAMSDAQLAERRIKREDIVQHVFADRFYC